MPDIIPLTGNLGYTITLDPSSWLFDDRKVDLITYFNEPHDEKTTTPKIKKRDLLKNDYTLGIPFKPFLENAEPLPEASTVIIETRNEEYNIPLEEARAGILAFSKEGKFLNEDGPAHFYYGDGSNKNEPITDIVKFTVR